MLRSWRFYKVEVFIDKASPAIYYFSGCKAVLPAVVMKAARWLHCLDKNKKWLIHHPICKNLQNLPFRVKSIGQENKGDNSPIAEQDHKQLIFAVLSLD